jgi:dienelactone hydrolase
MGARILFAVLVLLLLGAAPALAFDPARELRNYSKIGERFSQEQANADYQIGELAVGMANFQSLLERDLGAGGKRLSLTLCGSGFQGCAGDIRAYGYHGEKGVQVPFIFVNDNGAHLEGHMWASFATLARYQRSLKTRRRGARPCRRTRRRCARRRAAARPRKFPGVVIQTGSVQAPERLYWWAAQTLAAHGYVVMTFDVQGQGRSDTFGSGPDMFSGVPAQQPSVFVGDLFNAIDFFHSSAAKPYRPRREPAVARQQEEVATGAASSQNPLSLLLDRRKLGIVGHSLGAYSVSHVQGVDGRVDAVVGWDNLGSTTTTPGSQPVQPRVPALGMSADYFLTPTPYTSDPDPQAKNRGFASWQEAGLDTMQLNVRGGTHYEWSYISNPAFGATLRGMDMAGWYTTAWLDKYVKGRASADRRLLTTRWLSDAREAAVDPEGDGNMLSFYYPSRIAIGGVRCDDVRAGCAALSADDGQPAEYSVLDDR